MFYFWKQIGTYYNKLIPMKNTKFWDFETFYFLFKIHHHGQNFDLEIKNLSKNCQIFDKMKFSLRKTTLEDYYQKIFGFGIFLQILFDFGGLSVLEHTHSTCWKLSENFDRLVSQKSKKWHFWWKSSRFSIENVQ